MHRSRQGKHLHKLTEQKYFSLTGAYQLMMLSYNHIGDRIIVRNLTAICWHSYITCNH